jgi:hypothetical protein
MGKQQRPTEYRASLLQRALTLKGLSTKDWREILKALNSKSSTGKHCKYDQNHIACAAIFQSKDTDKIKEMKISLRDSLLNSMKVNRKVQFDVYMAKAEAIFEERKANGLSYIRRYGSRPALERGSPERAVLADG